MATQVAITSQSVPDSFCFTNWQDSWPVLVALLQASLGQTSSTGGTVEISGSDLVIVSSATPDAEDENRIWFRLNADGTPDRPYIHAQGTWMWPHHIPINDPRRWMFAGEEANIATLDGGTAGTATLTTGPFWEKDSDFDARMPLGHGTLPVSEVVVSTTNPTGGVDKHVLTKKEMPEHNHGVDALADTGAREILSASKTGADGNFGWRSGGGDQGRHDFVAEGEGDAHQNMPPYRGVFFIKRTGRKYYTPS